MLRPHGSLRLPARFSPAARPIAPDASGTDRATGAIARPGTRLPYPGGADHLRERRYRYPGGCGPRRAPAHVRGPLVLRPAITPPVWRGRCAPQVQPVWWGRTILVVLRGEELAKCLW